MIPQADHASAGIRPLPAIIVNMPSRLSWSNLAIGLVALAAVIGIAVAVLLFAGIGQIRGKKMHLYVATNQARGVMRGTEVWVAGQKVGLVDAIGFGPANSDTSGRVVIAISVKANDAAQIRRDSPVQVKSGANVIAPAVVYLEAGSPTSPPAHEGDTLRAHAQSDLETATVKFNEATEQIGPLVADARIVMARVRDPSGTVGAILTEGFGGQVTRLRRRVNALHVKMTDGDGEPVHTSQSALMADARAALARVDSIRALLGSTTSSFGRFRRDSTLGGRVAAVRDELARMRDVFNTTEGTLGRINTDSALTRSLSDAQREMALLFADIRRRPMHYVQF